MVKLQNTARLERSLWNSPHQTVRVLGNKVATVSRLVSILNFDYDDCVEDHEVDHVGFTLIDLQQTFPKALNRLLPIGPL
jgi:hypothetical protein